MAARRPAGAAALEAPLLHLSREAARLAALLPRLLAPAERRAAVQAAGLPPRAGAAGDLRIARELGRNRQLLRGLADALARGLPAPAEADAAEAPDDDDARLALLHRALRGADAAAWEQAFALAESWGDALPARRDRKAGAKPAAGGGKGAAKNAGKGAADARGAGDARAAAEAGASDAARLKDAKAALKEERREKARLERELGKAHQAEEKLRARITQLEGRLREAEQRAAEAKKRLAAAVAPAARERALEKQAAEAARRAGVAEQKLHIVEFERDDLRACLEDSERFLEAADEEVPSFRDRPLLAAEVALAEALAAARYRPRILVVGGGEPQRRHRGKFAEYAEVMGFDGEWRMAEYVSWHKEMGRLEADMRERFDALVILHWNRTTFTRKAREICNEAGQRPCITCHYEGFTSLRETLQECLRQLLAARG